MKIGRRAMLAAGLGIGMVATRHASAAADAPLEELELWPGGAPGRPAAALQERIEDLSTDPSRRDRVVTGIARPRLWAVRPAKPSGAALLIAPGGSYRRLVIDREALELARRAQTWGVTAFVLLYRLPGEGWASAADAPLADAQRAMRLIRARARDFALDPARIAAAGFSAGGHVCAELAMRFDASAAPPVRDATDRLPARPCAVALLYPVVSMRKSEAHAASRQNLLGDTAGAGLELLHSPHLQARPDAPAHFLVHAEDDAAVSVEHTLRLRSVLREKGVSVDTHLFAQGGHGFGMQGAAGKAAAVWPELLHAWGMRAGWLNAATAQGGA